MSFPSASSAAPTLVASSTVAPDPTNIPVQPPSPALPPGRDPVFLLGPDGKTWHTNTTIDDFSPLVVFSTRPHEWVTHLDVNSDNSTEPRPDLPTIPFGADRFLGTYRYTEQQNATATIEFWGSAIRLYGDGGPAYGAYSLKVDDEEPTLHTQHSLAQPIGRDIRMHALTNLTEGRHELVITALGTRDGLIEGPALLFDYAVVTQKVGNATEDSSRAPQSFNIRADDLTKLKSNGTWALNTIQDDVPPGAGGAKPEIYIERKAFWTRDNFAVLTHKFKGNAIQVFGGWNATHGHYRATLTSTKDASIIHSRIYNESAACDFVAGDDEPAEARCKWRGSVLKYAVADLNAELEYELALQNIHQGEGRIFEVDLIRVIGAHDAGQPPSLGSEGEPDESGIGYRNGTGPWMSVYALLTILFALKRVLKL